MGCRDRGTQLSTAGGKVAAKRDCRSYLRAPARNPLSDIPHSNKDAGLRRISLSETEQMVPRNPRLSALPLGRLE